MHCKHIKKKDAWRGTLLSCANRRELSNAEELSDELLICLLSNRGEPRRRIQRKKALIQKLKWLPLKLTEQQLHSLDSRGIEAELEVRGMACLLYTSDAADD